LDKEAQGTEQTESDLTISLKGYTAAETALIFDLLKYFDSRRD